MPVIVRYESGFDTKLVKAARLEALINEKGEPKFDPARNVWAWEDGTTYVLKQPFAGDKRKIVGLSTVPWTESDEQLRAILSKPDPVRRCYCYCGHRWYN